jgi:hypothetical protein
MRFGSLALTIVFALAAAKPRTALAQEAPAAVEPPPPRPSSSMKPTFMITGYSLVGLGTLTLMASGIVFLAAAGAAGRLDEECPNKRCVEGSEGADALERARDGEQAADVLVGIALPVMTAGFVLVLYSGGFQKSRTTVRVAPSVTARSAGGSVGVSF